jgi:predicted nucleotidyltransferase
MTTRRELARLVDAGVVERRTDTRPHQYRLPTDAPMTAAITTLLCSTVGVEALLGERVKDVPGIRAAAIYGSWASGSVTPSSDVDVLILTDVDRSFDMARVRTIERDVAELVGRDVDAMVFDVSDAQRKLKDGNGFLRNVMQGPMIPLVGDIARELSPEGDE